MKKRKKYRVGYGKPPKHSQFQPGQSGNSRGRPPSRKNFKTEFAQELGSSVTVREGEKTRRISKRAALVKKLFAKGLIGDSKAMDRIFSMAEKHLPDEFEAVTRAMASVSDAEIIERVIEARVAAKLAEIHEKQSSTPPRRRLSDAHKNRERRRLI